MTPAKRRSSRGERSTDTPGAGGRDVAPTSRTTPKGSRGRVPVAATDSRSARRRAAAERRSSDGGAGAGRRAEAPDGTDDAPDDDGRDAPAKAPYGAWALIIAFAVAQILSTVAYVVMQGVTDYDFAVPPGVGTAVGQAAGQVATGQVVDVGVPPPLWVTALVQLPLWIGLAAVPIWFAVVKGKGVVADLGLKMKAVDVPVGLAIGVACQLVLVPALYWVVFRLIGVRDVSAAARELTDRATDPLSIVLVFLVVGIGAPLAEEIYFRGMAQRIFGRRLRPHWAILASATFFAASHLQPLQFPALLVFGLVLGTLAWRAGRLGPAIWAHLGFNVVTATTLVFHLG